LALEEASPYAILLKAVRGQGLVTEGRSQVATATALAARNDLFGVQHAAKMIGGGLASNLRFGGGPARRDHPFGGQQSLDRRGDVLARSSPPLLLIVRL